MLCSTALPATWRCRSCAKIPAAWQGIPAFQKELIFQIGWGLPLQEKPSDQKGACGLMVVASWNESGP